MSNEGQAAPARVLRDFHLLEQRVVPRVGGKGDDHAVLGQAAKLAYHIRHLRHRISTYKEAHTPMSLRTSGDVTIRQASSSFAQCVEKEDSAWHLHLKENRSAVVALLHGEGGNTRDTSWTHVRARNNGEKQHKYTERPKKLKKIPRLRTLKNKLPEMCSPDYCGCMRNVEEMPETTRG